MMYQCDVCECYLDPGEGRLCDECREKENRRAKKMRTINEALQLGKDQQYELILGGAR